VYVSVNPEVKGYGEEKEKGQGFKYKCKREKESIRLS